MSLPAYERWALHQAIIAELRQKILITKEKLSHSLGFGNSVCKCMERSGPNPALIKLNFSHIHLNRNRVPRDQIMSRPS